MNVLRIMALYIDHVMCLLSLNEAGAFRTVKHRYTPNKSMNTSTEEKIANFSFNRVNMKQYVYNAQALI